MEEVGENWRVLIVRYKDEPRQDGRNEVASGDSFRAGTLCKSAVEESSHPSPCPLPVEGRGDRKSQAALRFDARALSGGMLFAKDEEGEELRAQPLPLCQKSDCAARKAEANISGSSLQFALVRFSSGGPPPLHGSIGERAHRRVGERNWGKGVAAATPYRAERFSAAFRRLPPPSAAWRGELFLRPALWQGCPPRYLGGYGGSIRGKTTGNLPLNFAWYRLVPLGTAWRGRGRESVKRRIGVSEYRGWRRRNRVFRKNLNQ